MTAKQMAVVSAVVAVALIVPAATASAQTPNAAICAVSGHVSLSPGVDGNAAPGSYNFDTALIQCAGTILANYNVDASGATTGLVSSAGETCEEGRSNGPGSISATRISGTGPASLSGSVEFLRAGSNVAVTGTLNDPSTPANPDYRFVALLEFTPDQQTGGPANDPTAAAACAPGGPRVTGADLNGTALIVPAVA